MTDKNYLDPFDPRYPDAVERLASLTEPQWITRENVDELLDKHRIEVHMKNGNWWEIRRNGKTKLWKSQPHQIRIPFKYGFKGYGAITTWDFDENGRLRTDEYRVKPAPEVAK